MAIIWDLIVFGVILTSIASAYRKGFVHTILSLVGMMLSFVLAFFFSKTVAIAVYTSYIRDRLITVVYDKIQLTEIPQIEDLDELLTAIAVELPTFLSKPLVESIGGSMETLYNSINTSDIAQFASSLVELLVAPLTISVLQTIAFCIIFSGLTLLVKLLLTLVGAVSYIPVLKSFNALLGGVFGAVQGVIYVFICCAVLWLVMTVVGDSIPLLNQEVIDSTYLLQHFFSIGSAIEETLKGMLS